MPRFGHSLVRSAHSHAFPAGHIFPRYHPHRAPAWHLRARPRVAASMPCTVTFYALRPGLGEVPVTVYRVERLQLVAYTGAPGVALAAARTGKGEPKADGSRVVDPGGRVVLDYLDHA